MFLAIFSSALKEELIEGQNTRIVLKLPAILAPYKLAILPLIKKDGLPEMAREILEDLKWKFNVSYDEKDAVGRRYRRQDAQGTPFCVTVDHQSLEDKTVTIRDRDTMIQERILLKNISNFLDDKLDIRTWLQKK